MFHGLSRNKPFFGITNVGRQVVCFLICASLVTLAQTRQAGSTALTERNSAAQPFYVYRDADSAENHFTPSGYMGDCGDIQMNEAFDQNPHSGATAIRVIYRAKGKGPNECPYSPPCRWSGVYWQEPPNNWGKVKVFAGKGLNLSRYNRLTFWARADRQGTVKFMVGGIAEQFGDTLVKARSRTVRIGTAWEQFEIDLTAADLKHIIGGFGWTADQDNNPEGLTFYLDDIRFEAKP